MTNSRKNKVLFFLAFAAAGFAALQVPFTQLAGSGAKFTVFDAFGPVAGGFLGGAWGAAAVLLMKAANLLAHRAPVDTGTIIDLFPMIFAAIYFSGKKRLNVIVPALCIIVFVTSPIGRLVWFYALFWLIPIACYFLQDRFILARSLGATFTAHAVGGALWVYLVPLPPAVWVGLIPIVALERLTFAAGIAATYVLLNNVFYLLNKKNLISYRFPVQEKYVLVSGASARN